MKILFKGGKVLNVFTEELQLKNVLIENDKIIGVDDYDESEADKVIDVSGKVICPSLVDGHIHIESTMLTPYEFAKATVVHGTGSVVCDPHEIANVCGINGIKYMMEASKNLPVTCYFMLPSCVPATSFDESGAVLNAKDLKPLYKDEKVLGLAEMMNYVGVINNDKNVLDKISDAHKENKVVDGHAPMLNGKALDKYLKWGINSDHECSSAAEGIERINKGQCVMIRQGTAARNLNALLPLFDSPYYNRCLLVTDDKHPADLLGNGHIDSIIRESVKNGKNVITAVKMASFNACQCFGIKGKGAVAPGFKADFLILDDLQSFDIRDVYKDGKCVVENHKAKEFAKPEVALKLKNSVLNTVHSKSLTKKDFYVKGQNKNCNVIQVINGELITKVKKCSLNFEFNNGIDVEKDILKIAVVERHGKSGNIGKGYITGIGLKNGAIASTVSHDSHNLIIIGTSDQDMAFAANEMKKIGGGLIFVEDGNVKASLPLKIAGLMSDESAETVAELNEKIRSLVKENGTNPQIEPFMNMAFVSLAVIPEVKITTKGLVDVTSQKLMPLFQ